MKTYWFTIATAGSKYERLSKLLVGSAKNHGIDVDVIVPKNQTPLTAKATKISGILTAPKWAERIVFVDADCMLVDPSGIENYNGSCKSPFCEKILSNHCVQHLTKKQQSIAVGKLIKTASEQGFNEFTEGTRFTKSIWLSGVITGHREFMVDLANEWKKWFNIVLECNGGKFARDQISFKFAYRIIHDLKYGYQDLPLPYNRPLTRYGCPGGTKIIHFSGSPSDNKWKLWKRTKLQILDGSFENLTEKDKMKLMDRKFRSRFHYDN